MKDYNFQGHSFKMNGETQRFFEKYINRIHSYASKKYISSDIVDDIEQSILEKLLEIDGDVSQKKIVEIVNAMGEPEDIFGDEGNDGNISDDKSNKEEIGIDKKTAVFLGVCSRLGRGNKIVIRVLRVLFLFAVCFKGSGIGLYIGLFLIKSLIKSGTVDEVSPRIKRIINRIHEFIVRICGTCIWSIIKFCFYGALSLGLLFAIGVAIGTLVCFYGDLFPILDDPYLDSIIKGYPIWTIRSILACLIFRFITFIKAFTKEPIKNRVAHYAVVGIFVVSLILAMAKVVSCVWLGDYSYVVGVETKEKPLQDDGIDIQMINEKNQYISYLLHESDEFRLQWSYDIRAKSNTVADVFAKNIKLPEINQKSKSEYEIVRTGNDSDLRFDGGYLQDIILHIYLPKGFKANLHRGFHRCQNGNEIVSVGNGNFNCIGDNEYPLDTLELRMPETDANLILQTIKNKDIINFSEFVSEAYGVEFFPYGRKSNFKGFKLTNEELFKELASSSQPKKYIRGKYKDGIGKIEMTIEEYFENYIYDVDFLKADRVSVVDRENVTLNSDYYRLVNRYEGSVLICYEVGNQELNLILVPQNNIRKLVAVVRG